MTDVKWIKIATDTFDDEKILLIESMPFGDSILVIWFKLLCLAGKKNNDGVFLMNQNRPYTVDMLATIFGKDVKTVKAAIDILEQFGLIEMVNDVITIPNWSKHQRLEKIKARNEYMRIYMQERRKAQKALICDSRQNLPEKVSSVNADVNTDVNVNNANNVSDVNTDVNVNTVNKKVNCKQPVSSLDRYKQDNKYKKDYTDDRDIEPVPDTSNEYLSDLGIISIPEFLKGIIDEWNTLESYGVKPLKHIDPESDTAFKIYTDIKNHGRQSFTDCIENIKKSDYLLGRAEQSKNTVSFSWLVDEINYLKVYEGTYDNFNPFPTVGSKKGKSTFTQMQSTKVDFNDLESKLLDN